MDFCQHVVCLVPQTEGEFKMTETSEENAAESIHKQKKSHTVKQREPLITIQLSDESFLIIHRIISCPSSHPALHFTTANPPFTHIHYQSITNLDIVTN